MKLIYCDIAILRYCGNVILRILKGCILFQGTSEHIYNKEGLSNETAAIYKLIFALAIFWGTISSCGAASSRDGHHLVRQPHLVSQPCLMRQPHLVRQTEVIWQP